MTRHDPRPFAPMEADLLYEPNGYTIRRHGTFVRCAVTGATIPLETLRYWSVERQEAYATREASLEKVRALRLYG